MGTSWRRGRGRTSAGGGGSGRGTTGAPTPPGRGAGVFAQRYDESTDAAGPLVGPVMAGGVLVTPNIMFGQNVPQFTAAFSGNLDTSGGSSGASSVTNAANWGLSYNGLDISSRI